MIGTRTSATASTSHTATRPRKSPSTFSSIGTRNSVTVYADPEKGEYRSVTSPGLSASPSTLPAPVGFTLETEKLKDFAD